MEEQEKNLQDYLAMVSRRKIPMLITMAVVFLLGVVVAILAWPAAVLADKPVITVSTVEELYSEVNDPTNMNVVIQLIAGMTYTLRADSYPNGGRLVLQPGMDLVGENEYEDLDGDGV